VISPKIIRNVGVLSHVSPDFGVLFFVYGTQKILGQSAVLLHYGNLYGG
jgi:hypothetical protein